MSSFPEKVVNDCILEFKQLCPKLEETCIMEERLKHQLKTSMENMKKGVEQEKAKLAPKVKRVEKTPEEKIQEALNLASEKNQNLVLIGKGRSLGLAFTVIEEINKDKNYRQDIVGYIRMLLDTPTNQDFTRGGSSRWKPVRRSNKELYELSVDPDTGSSQGMPRFYAKEELFAESGDNLELTNSKDRREKRKIWILVKKGDKRAQKNDVETAEKIYFENDGKRHDGAVSVNSFGWEKCDIRSSGDLPQQIISAKKSNGRC